MNTENINAASADYSGCRKFALFKFSTHRVINKGIADGGSNIAPALASAGDDIWNIELHNKLFALHNVNKADGRADNKRGLYHFALAYQLVQTQQCRWCVAYSEDKAPLHCRRLAYGAGGAGSTALFCREGNILVGHEAKHLTAEL